VAVEVELLVVPLYDLHCAHGRLLQVDEPRGKLELFNLVLGAEWRCSGSKSSVVLAHAPEVGFKVFFGVELSVFRIVVVVVTVGLGLFILRCDEVFLAVVVVLFGAVEVWIFFTLVEVLLMRLRSAWLDDSRFDSRGRSIVDEGLTIIVDVG